MLPILANQGAEGLLPLGRQVDLTASGPKRLFGLTGKARIAMGYDADSSIVDLKSRWTIEESWLASRFGWPPFTGMRFTRSPVGTIISGNSVMWDGQLSHQAAGQPFRSGAPHTQLRAAATHAPRG